MKRRVLVLVAALVVSAAPLYAGNGDLIINGTLGVGTAIPAAKLDVAGGIKYGLGSFGNTAIVAENGWLRDAWLTGQGLTNIHWDDTSKKWKRWSAGDPGSCYGYNDFGGILHSSAQLYFIKGECGGATEWTHNDFINNYTKMTIVASGNVGIGTTNPQDSLEVSGNVFANAFNSTGYLSRYFATGGLAFAGLAGSPYAYISAYSDSSGTGKKLVLQKDGGNVGIGTITPDYKLQVMGDVASNTTVLTSDARFKKNLLPISTPLDKVLNLTGLSYEWKIDEYKEKGFAEGRHYGVIAQEIEKVLPEVVNTAPDGSKAVAYTEIIPVLIEAIKEQQKQIDELKKLVRASSR